MNEGKFPQILEEAVKTMKKGEKAEFSIKEPNKVLENSERFKGKIPPNHPKVICTIELVDFEFKEKTKWDFEPEERFPLATSFKAQGNDFFKANQFKKAIELYLKSLDFVELDPSQKAIELRTSCLLNLSACYLKEKEHRKAIDTASTILHEIPNHVKALYRRAMAYADFNMLDKAEEDLRLAKTTDPSNNDLDKELKNLDERKKAVKSKEKNIFSKVFQDKGFDYIEKCEYSNELNPVVFITIKIADEAPFTFEIELFKNLVPKTAENFRALCTGEKGAGKECLKLTYKGSPIHKIIKDFLIEGGDIVNFDGTGGESIYGPTFPDENFITKHIKRGILSMQNAGKNTNNSKFWILFKPANWLDDMNVVFGYVRRGQEYLNKFDNIECDENHIPKKKEILIVDCGEILKPK